MGVLRGNSGDPRQENSVALVKRAVQVSEAVPLSAATLQRLLEAAQGDADADSGGGGGGALEAALQQLDPRELQEFERFVSSGQVHMLPLLCTSACFIAFVAA